MSSEGKIGLSGEGKIVKSRNLETRNKEIGELEIRKLEMGIVKVRLKREGKIGNREPRQ
ncbi:MAG: hypothetical protein WAL87_08635 [Chthoniobacterales bacterium]